MTVKVRYLSDVRKPLRVRLVTATLLAATCLLPLQSRAQYMMEFAQTYNAPMSNFISTTFLNQQTIINSIQSDHHQKAAPALPLAPPQLERNAVEHERPPAPVRAMLNAGNLHGFGADE
jgi:hypothetical protein